MDTQTRHLASEERVGGRGAGGHEGTREGEKEVIVSRRCCLVVGFVVAHPGTEVPDRSTRG